MAEKEAGKPARPPRTLTTPADYPITPAPLSGLDHSFTLQTIMELQKNVGQLTQAVTTLTDASKDHGGELKAISKDIHAAKVVVSVIGGLILLVGAVIAWLVNTYISTHPAK